MSGFDFDLDDINKELGEIRGGKTAPKAVPVKTPTKNTAQAKAEAPAPKKSANARTQEHTQEEDIRDTPADARLEKSSGLLDWAAFQTLPGVFDYVGGARPVQFHEGMRRTQVSGLPDSMIQAVQRHLRDRHAGAEVNFPWGVFKITADNRVFHAKSSCLRYLLFAGLRDEELSHVQYAKQWLALTHNDVFEPTFRPETLNPNNDELDIYALLVVSSQSEDVPTIEPGMLGGEQFELLQSSLSRVMDKLASHDAAFDAFAARTNITETVLLLDRMGLLKGGLPKNVGEFVRVLELNRNAVQDVGQTMVRHAEAEEARARTLARDARLRELRAQRGAKS